MGQDQRLTQVGRAGRPLATARLEEEAAAEGRAHLLSAEAVVLQRRGGGALLTDAL